LLHPPQVFGTSDNLQKFVSLRTKYLLTILKEVLGVKDMRDISADKKAYLISLSSLDFKSRDFDRLIVFDAVQFSRTWAREWNNLLQKTNSFKDLSKYLEDMKNVVTDNENPEEPPASKLSMKSVAGFREAAEGRKEGRTYRTDENQTKTVPILEITKYNKYMCNTYKCTSK
jgi:hypothetical protein